MNIYVHGLMSLGVESNRLSLTHANTCLQVFL